MKLHNNVHKQQQLAKKIVRRTARRGTMLVMAGAMFWAISGACVQFLTQSKGFSPEWLASARILASGFLLTLIGIFQNKGALKELWKNKRDILSVAAYGIFGIMLLQFTYIKAIAASNAATGTVLQYTGPILIIIAVCIRKLKLPTIAEFLSIILAVSGVFLLATHGDIHSLAISKGALFWGLSSAVGFMLYSVLPSKIIPKYGSILTSGLGMLSGGIVMLFVARPWQYTVSFDLSSVLAFICLAFVGTTVGYTLYLQGVSDIGPVKASMLASIEPVVSAVLSVALGASLYWWHDYAGMACIIATVFLLSIPVKHVKISIRPTARKKAEKQKNKTTPTPSEVK